MSLEQRIGLDSLGLTPIEESLAFGAEHGFHFINFCADQKANRLESFDAARVRRVREAAERHGIRIGLHTLSGVNVAEVAPLVGEAVDAWLAAYVDLATRLGSGWIVVHGGFHFGPDHEARREAGIERLKRAAGVAEKAGVRLLLENMNREPDVAEVQYLACTLAETRLYLDRLADAGIGWSFTVNHAHMEPEGIDGFLDGLDLGICGEVRLADNRGQIEEHLQPGDGTIDFGHMFRRIEAMGYAGHYMMAFGTAEDMRRGREHLVARAREAGVAGI
jgi:sugar phosphate isomerase/epimerase